MSTQESSSAEKNQLESIVGDDTPTASALLRLRRAVYEAVPGAGAVTKTAQETSVPRTELARVIAPKTIRRVALVERHLHA